MTRKGGSLLVAFSCLAITLSGCGSQSSGSQGTSGGPVAAQEIRIVAKDNIFEPANYTAQAGKTVRFVVTNSGRNVHEVEVKGLVPETKLAPGQEKTVDTAVLAAGTYKIYCEIHEDENMIGELVVK